LPVTQPVTQPGAARLIASFGRERIRARARTDGVISSRIAEALSNYKCAYGNSCSAEAAALPFGLAFFV